MSFKELSQKQKYKYVERTAAGGNGGPFIQYLKGCSTSQDTSYPGAAFSSFSVAHLPEKWYDHHMWLKNSSQVI